MAIFVHEAWLALPRSGGDTRAPGAAVTVALCGHWEHDGTCRWPHHTSVESRGGKLVVRVLFSVDAGDETAVREKIVEALRAGTLTHEGRTTTWTLLSNAAATATADETARGERLGKT